MHLIELSSADKDRYNQFVANAPTGSFLQAWEWGQWQQELGREVRRFFVFEDKNNDNNDDNRGVVGSIQLIKMRLAGKKYYWYAPYGPVISDGSLVMTGHSLLQTLQNNFVGAVFIRIEPKIEPSIIANLSSLTKTKNIQPGKTLIVDLAKSEDMLLAEMHPKTRYNIKLAQKHSVEIQDEFMVTVGHGLFFDEALELILKTSARQRFFTYSADYYKNLVDFFALKNRGNIKLHIYKAVFRDRLLAAAIMVDFGKTRTFLFGGSSELDRNVMAPYLLHWQAIKDAKAAGYLFYDFWGIETSSGAVPGFVRFKLGFGGRQMQYAGSFDIIWDRLWYKLYGYGRTINRLIKKASA